MDPTSLLLILCLGSDQPCQVRHQAHRCLEAKGLAALPVVLQFTQDKDIEVAKRCSNITELITNRFISEWVTGRQFKRFDLVDEEWVLHRGMTAQHLFIFYCRPARAYTRANPDATWNNHQYRAITMLWAVDILSSGGASFHNLAELLE